MQSLKCAGSLGAGSSFPLVASSSFRRRWKVANMVADRWGVHNCCDYSIIGQRSRIGTALRAGLPTILKMQTMQSQQLGHCDSAGASSTASCARGMTNFKKPDSVSAGQMRTALRIKQTQNWLASFFYPSERVGARSSNNTFVAIDQHLDCCSCPVCSSGRLRSAI